MAVPIREPVPRRRFGSVALLLVGLGWLLAAGSLRAAAPQVVILPTTGIVDDGMATYLSQGVAKATSDGAAAVVIKLDTPGGSLQSTNDIVGTLLEARIPVIVWVAPAGGFAASAGTFITLAANIALMAPGTSIGAASPVGGQGEDITGTEGQKVLNDAIAKITSIAQARHRNVDWAVSAVRDAKSSPVSEAVAVGAVDGEAATIDDVLAFANGRKVEVAGGQEVTLDLTGATTTEMTMNPFASFIRLLSDPTIAFLLLSGGSAGLLAELWNPNFVTGILGGLAIILALIGLGSLPLNIAGLLLFILGMVLFGLELTVPSHGLLGVGGLVCFVLGASALFSAPGDRFEPVVRVATPVLVTATVTLAVFLGLIVTAAVRSRRMIASPGTVGAGPVPPGSSGIVRKPLEPLGSIYVAGEEWSARTSDGRPLQRGSRVRVLSVDGLTLTVEPEASSSNGA